MKVNRLVLVMFVFVSLLGGGRVWSAGDGWAEGAWKGKCAGCHGDDGKGDTNAGKKMKITDMSTVEWNSKHHDADIEDAIENGVKSEQVGLTHAFKSKFNGDQIDALVKYIRSFPKTSSRTFRVESPVSTQLRSLQGK